jgi:site-specific recombinase XerD
VVGQLFATLAAVAAMTDGGRIVLSSSVSVRLPVLERACRGSSFAQRRDAAIVAVFRATGIRLSEMAGIRYDAMDAARSELDSRQIRIRGKGGKERTVKIDYEAARRVNRYLRARTRQGQAYRPGPWLGVSNRGPLTANGIYEMVRRRGRERGVEAYPHRFRHHFSHTSWTGAVRRGT